MFIDCGVLCFSGDLNRRVALKKTMIPTNLILNVRLVGIMANSSGANGYCIFSLGITPTVALRSTPYDTPHDQNRGSFWILR